VRPSVSTRTGQEVPPRLDAMARRPLRLSALAWLVAPALVACGGATTPTTPQPARDPSTGTTAPAPITAPTAIPAPTGITITGSGYSFRVPKHWRNVTGTIAARGIDAAAAADLPVAGFANNINVSVSDTAFTRDQLDMVTELARAKVGVHSTDYAVAAPTLVAGAIAGHLRGPYQLAKKKYWLEQFLVAHSGHTYVVSFSFSPAVSAAKRDKLIASVLSGWTWR